MMRSIYGITAAPRAIRWLERSKRARILNLFPKALNLVNDGQDVLSIVVPEVKNGPFAVVVDCSEIPNPIQFTDQIVIQNEDIHIGDVTFHMGSVNIWNPIPDWQSLAPVYKTDLVDEIETQLSRKPYSGGIAEVFYSVDIPVSNIYKPKMQRGSTLLLEGLREKDTEKIMSGAEELGGLGVGLTPSGDDFLMGVVYGLWTTKRPEEAANTANLIWAGAAGQTTTLAREWLAAAVGGEAVESWHDLATAVLGEKQEKISAAVGEILETGETSGADALSGFVQALKMAVGR